MISGKCFQRKRSKNWKKMHKIRTRSSPGDRFTKNLKIKIEIEGPVLQRILKQIKIVSTIFQH